MHSHKFLIRLLMFIFSTSQFFTFSQIWTDPVNISGDGVNFTPGFTIDIKGNMHCVWVNRERFFEDDYKIMYSKSTDDGGTWTTPESISYCENFRIEDPHIVADSSGNLHVTYDYDVDGWPSVQIHYICLKMNQIKWSEPIKVATGHRNNIIIDHSDRIYFFWNYGTAYYKYLENGIFSWIGSPSYWLDQPCFFYGFDVDEHNQLHCIGERISVPGTWRTSYFIGQPYNWSVYQDLEDHSVESMGISLNASGEASFVWRIKPPGVFQRETYFSRIENDSATDPVLLAKGTHYPSIVHDSENKPHIIESVDTTWGELLVHRFIENEYWEYEVLDQTGFKFLNNIPILRNNILYLIYDKVDTTIAIPPETYDGYILFRKLELSPGIESSDERKHFSVFPNPFSDHLTIEFERMYNFPVDIYLFDLYGNMVLEKRIGTNESHDRIISLHKYYTELENLNDGIFTIRIVSKEFSVSKCLIKAHH